MRFLLRFWKECNLFFKIVFVVELVAILVLPAWTWYIRHKPVTIYSMTSAGPGGSMTITQRSDLDYAQIELVGDTAESTVTMAFHKCPLIQALDTLKQIGISTSYGWELGTKHKSKMKPITLDVHCVPISQFLKKVFELEPELTYEYQKTHQDEGQIWIRESEKRSSSKNKRSS